MKSIIIVLLSIAAGASLMIMGQAFSQTKNKKDTEKMKQIEQKDHYTFQLSDKVTWVSTLKMENPD